MSDQVPENVVKRVLLTFDPKQYHVIMAELEHAGWTSAVLNKPDEFPQHDPDWVGCVLIQGANEAYALELLNWCERSSKWKYTPKVVIGTIGAQFTNVVNIQPDTFVKPVIPYLIHAQKTREAAPPNRRNEYRHPLYEPVKVTAGGKQFEAMLLDISTGGARLEVSTADAFNPGGPVILHLQGDSLLQNLAAKVLSTHREAIGVVKVRLQYTNLPTAANRALGRFITMRQAKRLKARDE
jgi:hypothetical protein